MAESRPIYDVLVEVMPRPRTTKSHELVFIFHWPYLDFFSRSILTTQAGLSDTYAVYSAFEL